MASRNVPGSKSNLKQNVACVLDSAKEDISVAKSPSSSQSRGGEDHTTRAPFWNELFKVFGWTRKTTRGTAKYVASGGTTNTVKFDDNGLRSTDPFGISTDVGFTTDQSAAGSFPGSSNWSCESAITDAVTAPDLIPTILPTNSASESRSACTTSNLLSSKNLGWTGTARIHPGGSNGEDSSICSIAASVAGTNSLV